MSSLTIEANGQTITVSMTEPSGAATTHAQVNGSTVTFPQIISTDTTYTFTTNNQFTVSCVIGGAECFGQTLKMTGDQAETIAPSPTREQLSRPPSNFTPADMNYIAWSFDPAAAQTTQATTGGVVNLVKLKVSTATLITNVCYGIGGTAASGLTAGQNFVGLFDSTGALLGVSADQTTNFGSGGLKTAPLTVPQAVAAGYYYVGLLSNASTTQPSFYRGISSAIANGGLGAGAYRTATILTAQTSLASVTIANIAASANMFWVALS